MKCLECANPQRQKVHQWILGAGWEWRVTASVDGVSFWGDGDVVRLSAVNLPNSVNMLKITELYT